MPGRLTKAGETGVAIDGAIRKIRLANKLADAARRESAVDLADAWVDIVEEVSPRSTGRYVRGWQVAANDAGLPVRVVAPIRPNPKREEIEKALERQVRLWARDFDRWAALERRYRVEDARGGVTRTGRPRAKRTAQPYFRKILRNKRFALKRYKKALANLEAFTAADGGILIDAGRLLSRRRGGAYDAGIGYTKSGRRKLSTVRTKVYGGEGEIFDAGGRTLIRLRNLEPHASIVESKRRIRAQASAAVRGFGLTRLRRKYVETLRAGMGKAA